MAVLHIEPPSSLALRHSELGTALNDKNVKQISYASWDRPRNLIVSDRRTDNA